MAIFVDVTVTEPIAHELVSAFAFLANGYTSFSKMTMCFPQTQYTQTLAILVRQITKMYHIFTRPRIIMV